VTVDGSLSALNLPVKTGALVESVEPNTAASKAGIRGGTVSTTTEDGTVSVGGDIIVKIDGKEVASSEALAGYIEEKKAGEAITIELWRAAGGGKYKKLTLKATLGERPNSVPNPDTPEG
jgi:S1-C subfamily serine protease